MGEGRGGDGRPALRHASTRTVLRNWIYKGDESTCLKSVTWRGCGEDGVGKEYRKVLRLAAWISCEPL